MTHGYDRRRTLGLVTAGLAAAVSGRSYGGTGASFPAAGSPGPPTPAPFPVPSAAPAAPSAYSTTADVKTRTDQNDRMTAPVKVNGRGPLQFLVDTGADRTVLSRELATAMGLPPGPPVVIHGIAGMLPVETVLVERLDVGDRRLAGIAAPVLAERDLGAQGLLGIDSLKDQRLLLDFKRRRMLIQGGRIRDYDPNEIVVRAKSRFGQLTLVDSRLNHQDVFVILDSGAESTMANSAFHDRVERMRRAMPVPDVQLLSVTGQTALGAGAIIPFMQMGGFQVRNLPVVYADLHTFARWKLEDEPAMLLGCDVLRKFDTVWIDFVRREVRFRLPPTDA